MEDKYEEIKRQFENVEVDIANVSHLVKDIMIVVGEYMELTGEQKKDIVLRLVRDLLGDYEGLPLFKIVSDIIDIYVDIKNFPKKYPFKAGRCCCF